MTDEDVSWVAVITIGIVLLVAVFTVQYGMYRDHKKERDEVRDSDAA